jgi:hypothetical protein
MITTKERTFKTWTAASGDIQAEILFTVEVGNHGDLLSAEVEIVEVTDNFNWLFGYWTAARTYRSWKEEMLEDIVADIRGEIEEEKSMLEAQEDLNPHEQIRLELATFAM